MSDEKDLVSHPSHYTSHPSGVECKDIVQHFNFNKGGAIKYIWRSSHKGTEIQDLMKAMKLLEFEIDRLKKG